MILRPRPFPIVAARVKALQVPRDLISVEVPTGPDWVLWYIAVNYPRTVVANAQTSPNLSFELFDSEGRALTEQPIPFADVTTPAGQPRYGQVNPWYVWYPAKSVISMVVTGQTAGPVPANISITYIGYRGWSRTK